MFEDRNEKYFFWHFFEDITKIPHGSGNTEGIADYLIEFARDNELKVVKEECGNVIIYKPGSDGNEAKQPIILQGHMDMVAVSDPDCEIDITKDPLKLTVDGDWLTAEKTSLGGDDGIAIAYMLAILADNTLAHPPIEAVFTVDEEVGMNGAAGLDTFNLHSKRMINLDNEEEGVLITSCAGGAHIVSSTPVEWKERAANSYEIRVTGLKGGHSGTEIDKNRISAATIIARFLAQLKLVRTRIIDVNFGEKDNAIASSGYIKFICSAPKQDVIEVVDFYAEVMKEEFASREPDLNFEFNILGEMENVKALHKADSERIMDMLLALPQGISSMSGDIPGLVETSCNIGIVRLEEDGLKTTVSVRSSSDSSKQALCDKVIAVVALAGGESKQCGEYPAWEYKRDSKLRDHMAAVYEKMYGKAPVMTAIHAGVECGIFADKMIQLDCISIGPDMEGVHTTGEKLSISSAERTYDYLLEVIATLQ